MGIYKHRKGWVVDVHVNGERVRRKVDSKTEARHLLRELHATPPAPNYIALETLTESYLSSLRLRAKASSIKRMETKIRQLLRGLGPQTNATEIKLPELEAYVRQRMVEEEAGAHTVRGDLKVYKAVLRHAFDHELLPIAPIRLPQFKVGRRLPTIFEKDEVDHLLEVSPEPWASLLHIAVASGLRLGECRHLAVDDLDFSAGVIQVTAKPVVDFSPKSHSERRAPGSPALFKRLEVAAAQARAAHAKYRLRSRTTDPRCLPWLFPGIEGLPVTEQTALRHLRQCFQKAGLYTGRGGDLAHKLRRTWASSLAAKGVDLATISEMAGWSSLKMADSYIAAQQGHAKAAAAQLDW